MRILHLNPNLSSGGAERQLSYLAPELANRGHEVHVAYLHENDTPVMQGTGVHLHRLKASNNYDPRILLQLYSLIKQIEPDLVQSWILAADICAAIVATLTRTCWVIREPNWPARQPRCWKSFLRKELARLSSAIVTNSLCGMAYWRHKYPSKPMRMIRNGLPLGDITMSGRPQLHRSAQREPETHYILFVGRFDPQKNVGVLLDAMRHLRSDITLKLCGTGQLEAEYRRQIQALRIADRVTLLGRVDGKTVYTLMRKARAIVLISHYEGFPNVLLEAMLNRCPLVVSDIPPHREYLDETTACFVNKDDPQDVAEGIMRTFDVSQSNPARTEKAFRVASGFSIGRMADEYEAFYDQVLRGELVDQKGEASGETKRKT
jgi:glycosyltransferase involved in cell wall biosynthesis